MDEFQDLIEKTFLQRDKRRGVGGTFMWFVEEVGELSTELRTSRGKELSNEFADVAAWLFTLASLAGVRMSEATQKYADGCPACHAVPCTCPEKS